MQLHPKRCRASLATRTPNFVQASLSFWPRYELFIPAIPGSSVRTTLGIIYYFLFGVCVLTIPVMAVYALMYSFASRQPYGRLVALTSMAWILSLTALTFLLASHILERNYRRAASVLCAVALFSNLAFVCFATYHVLLGREEGYWLSLSGVLLILSSLIYFLSPWQKEISQRQQIVLAIYGPFLLIMLRICIGWLF